MRLVKSLTAACALIALLILVGCTNGGSSKNAVVRGVVMDSATSNALMDVTVKAGSVTAKTDLNGQYSLSVSSGSNIIVKATKTGYADVIDVCSISNGGAAEVDFALRTVGKTEDLMNMLNSEKAITDSRGTVVTLPDGCIYSDGAAVDTATIQVTTSIANDANYTETFPGLFIGTQGLVDKAIESYGFITVNITSGGKKCNLGPGKTATIDIPVGAGAADPGTADIDLWSLDEATGKWKWEVKANRIPGAPVVYRATVNHFSSYNLDSPIQTSMPLTITVKNGDAVVAGASIVAKTSPSTVPAWEGHGITGADGKFKFDSVPLGTNSIVATFGNLKGVGYSYTIVGGEAFQTVSLQTYTNKTILFYYKVGQTNVNAAGADVNIFSEGMGTGQGHSNFSGKTGADGKVTTLMLSTAGYFNISANITVGGITYSAAKNYTVFSDIPAEIELTNP